MEEVNKDLYDMGLAEAELDEPLADEMKEQIGKSIASLQKLFDEDINVDKATIEAALYYLPLFNIHGLILASILGVSMDEYYLITEHLAGQLGLLAEKEEKVI